MKYSHENKTIETKRLILRLFQPSDAEAISQLCNNYNIYKSTLYLPYPYSTEDALTWMKHHYDNFIYDKAYEWAVTDKETGTLYGAVALSNNRMFHHGELAYWIGEKFWGNGYATEAAKAMIQFAFKEKMYHKVFARSFSSNPASEKVLQKVGMEKEGVLKEHVLKENCFEDLVHYAIINSNK